MSNSKKLKFSDLTTFDIQLLQSRAKDEYISRTEVEVSTCLIEVVFEMIYAKGFDVVQTERPPTWSEPNKSLYDTKKHYKKPWMF